MHKGRITVVVLAGLGMLATFLPWRKVTLNGDEIGLAFNMHGVKQFGIDTWLGYVNLLFFAVILIMALVGNRQTMIAKGFPKMTVLVMSGLALVFAAIVTITYSMQDYTTAQFGLYLALAASILTALAPYFFNSDGSFDVPTIKEVADDIEDSADIVEDKVEDIADKVEDKIENKLGLDDDDDNKSEDKKEA